MDENLISKISRTKENIKKFNISIKLKDSHIGDLDGEIELCFVDNLGLRHTDFPEEYRPLVGYIKNSPDFVLLGVRRGENVFCIDIFDLEGGDVNQIFIIDDIAELEYISKILDVGEDLDETSPYWDTVHLFNVKKKIIAEGEDKKALDIYENILNLKNVDVDNLHPIYLYLSSIIDQKGEQAYYQFLTDQLIDRALILLVNIISNYLTKNRAMSIEDIIEDENFARKFRHVPRTKEKIEFLLKHYDLHFLLNLYAGVCYHSKVNSVFEEAPDNLIDYLD